MLYDFFLYHSNLKFSVVYALQILITTLDYILYGVFVIPAKEMILFLQRNTVMRWWYLSF